MQDETHEKRRSGTSAEEEESDEITEPLSKKEVQAVIALLSKREKEEFKQQLRKKDALAYAAKQQQVEEDIRKVMPLKESAPFGQKERDEFKARLREDAERRAYLPQEGGPPLRKVQKKPKKKNTCSLL